MTQKSKQIKCFLKSVATLFLCVDTNLCGYKAALALCGIELLIDRRQIRCLDFSLKCVKHKKTAGYFPWTKKHCLKMTIWGESGKNRNISKVSFCQRLHNTFTWGWIVVIYTCRSQLRLAQLGTNLYYCVF